MNVVAQRADESPRGTGLLDTLQFGWQAACDPNDIGKRERWFSQPPADGIAVAVPGYLQESFPGYHGLVWCWTALHLPDLIGGGRVVVRFHSIWYRAEVWLDGEFLGLHEGSGRMELDITESCRRRGGGDGVLVVRLLNPTKRRIDGLTLSEVPGANSFDGDEYWPGRMYNYGGITGPVELVSVSEVRLADIHVVPDLDAEMVEVRFNIRNDTGGALRATWNCEVGAGGDEFSRKDRTIEVPEAGVEVTCRLPVPSPRTWSTDRPFLYDLDISVNAVSASESFSSAYACSHRLRTGFREFAVDSEGFFRLNTRRIFVRSTHTGNHVPGGLDDAQKAALLRRDLLNAKAVGLNMVRFIASRATKEQLDLCDELGLMVYEECNGSWPFGYAFGMEDRFDAELRETILSGRNHPCVVTWGLLNETRDGQMFRHAVGSLPLVHALDKTRLVVLSSGRWDGDLSIGSVCNPGSDSWEHAWGFEAVDGQRVEVDPGAPDHLGYVDCVGDRHIYPQVPHSAADFALLRTMGQGGKPVFLSEYGVGSLFDAVREGRNLELAGAAQTLAEPTLISRMHDRYLLDFKRFGLDLIFAFPEDLFDDSYRTHSEHRLQGLNAMRANPLLAGHNITGMLDHAVTGEGMWTFATRELKPGVVDAVGDGLAPLRWNIHLDRRHSTVGSVVHLDLTLADEGVLTPGDYDGAVRIFGPDGPVWEQDFIVTAASARMVHPALSTDLPPDLGAGCFRVTAALRHKAAPRGRSITMWRSNPAVAHLTPGPLWVPTPDARLTDWLTGLGLDPTPEVPSLSVSPLILLSAAHDLTTDLWKVIRSRVGAGSTLVLLEAAQTLASQSWRDDPLLTMAADEGNEWLYHTETVGLRHELFAGLPGPGLMDWSWYGLTLPRARLVTSLTPTDTAAVSIGVGLHRPGGYTSGFVTAGWDLGQGRVVTNTLRLVEHLDSEPAAGLLLANLLRAERSLQSRT